MTLVESNILIDILSGDRIWLQWSTEQLIRQSDLGPLIIDEIIYAEIATRTATQDNLDAELDELDVQLNRIPRQALFLAAKAFRHYRDKGGNRQNVLPDFFIGPHAQVAHLPILTRDVRRYRTYYPDVALIAPQQ